MNITSDMIRGYLAAVGHPVKETDELTHQELGLFTGELSHKAGVSPSVVARAMGNIDLLPPGVITHIEATMSAPIERPVVTTPVVEQVVVPVVETPPAPAPKPVAAVVEPTPVVAPTPEPVVEEPVQAGLSQLAEEHAEEHSAE